jgi:hypothetical protein
VRFDVKYKRSHGVETWESLAISNLIPFSTAVLAWCPPPFLLIEWTNWYHRWSRIALSTRVESCSSKIRSPLEAMRVSFPGRTGTYQSFRSLSSASRCSNKDTRMGNAMVRLTQGSLRLKDKF